MPRFDGTGPEGKGPMTGRKKGKCKGDSGRGMGRGAGRQMRNRNAVKEE